jgi:hypothetical protein
MTKKVFISADHGMAIIYFLQSNVVLTLLAVGGQFTAYKSTLQQFLPFDMDKPM